MELSHHLCHGAILPWKAMNDLHYLYICGILSTFKVHGLLSTHKAHKQMCRLPKPIADAT